MPIRHLILRFILVFQSSYSFLLAQQIDPDFTPTIRGAGKIEATAEQQDGKIVVVGNFEEFNGVPAKRIVRLNSDGSVDESFNVGTGPDNGAFVVSIENVLIQDDGKVLLAGTFSSFDGFDRQRIARLNTDGSIDQEFAPPSNPEQIGTSIFPLAVQSDGKILYRQTSQTSTQILRLNADGSIDDSFSANLSGTIFEMAELPSGKIIIVGSMVEVNGSPINNIALLNSDGTLNDTYGSGTSNFIRTMVVQEDEKILLAGGFGMMRISEDGTVDQTFINNITNASDIEDLKVNETGKIYASGDDGNVWQADETGLLENTYTMSGISSRFTLSHLSLLNDGNVLAAGNGNGNDVQLVRLNSQLQSDMSFDIGLGPLKAGAASKGIVQSDGKIVIVGGLTYFNGLAKRGIVRLNPDLTVDETFNSGFGFNESNHIFFIARTTDDKIIVGGQFSEYNGNPIDRMVRLNQNGKLDTSFALDEPIISVSTQVVLLPDERLIYKDFNQLKRLNVDGTLDDSFVRTFDSNVLALGIQEDGKLLVYGKFTELNDEVVGSSLIRLNTDGTLDTSFKTEIPDNWNIKTIDVQRHGRILLGGEFELEAGVVQQVIRLRSTGQRDPGFILSPDNTGSGGSTYLLSDESALISGGPNLKRISPRGESLDFKVAYSQIGFLQGIVPLESSFFTLGTFTSIGDEPRDGLAYYTYSPLPDSPAAPQDLTYELDQSGHPELVWSDNSTDENGFLLIRISEEGSHVFELEANSSFFHDLSVSPNTSYQYWVVAFNSGGLSMQSNEVSVQVQLVTAIEEVTQPTVQVYPNPGGGIFKLDLPNRNAMLRVLSENGTLLQTINTANGITKIDLSNEPDGLYFLQLLQEEIISIKVLKKN